MKILAIETSCDETAIALVRASGGLKQPSFNVLSNIVSSQVEVHAPFWGVVPNLAKREHQKNLPLLLKTALKEGRFLISNFQFPISKQIPKSKIQTIEKILEREQELLRRFKKYILPLKPPKIDVIAVTHGPGLEPALWVGVNFAKALGFLWKKPIVGINHLEGHILSNWLNPIAENQKSIRQLADKNQNLKIQFPALCLVVSGGHTQLVLMKDFGKYKTIGETRDDAAGEAFDKVARMLGLGYPGGPAISRLAEKWKFEIRNSKFEIRLPRPMINSKDFDFSFSGLKTAVLYLIKDLERKGYSLKEFRAAVAAEFQQAVIDVLISKTLKAAENYKVKSVLLGGGVAANKNLRERMKKAVKEKLTKVLDHEPRLEFTTDNAAMIAAAAILHLREKKKWSKMKAKANLRLG